MEKMRCYDVKQDICQCENQLPCSAFPGEALKTRVSIGHRQRRSKKWGISLWRQE